jgi:hypothetical protein
MDDPFWIRSPRVLFDERVTEFFPFDRSLPPNRRANAAVRFSLFLAIALFVITGKSRSAMFALMAVPIICATHRDETRPA